MVLRTSGDFLFLAFCVGIFCSQVLKQILGMVHGTLLWRLFHGICGTFVLWFHSGFMVFEWFSSCFYWCCYQTGTC